MGSINVEKDSFVTSLAIFIEGSLIFVVSQAWNSAVQDMITKSQLDSYGRFVYALIITFVALYALRMMSKIKKIWTDCRSTIGQKCGKWINLLDI